MRPRDVDYQHRVEVEQPHKVQPTRDKGITNPNRCGVCGIAILRVNPDDKPTDKDGER